MILACKPKSIMVRVVGFGSSLIAWLFLAQAAMAQAATSSTASAGAKGGTTSGLPAAGTTEITYILFIGGLILFVVGTIKLVLSFRE